MELQDRIREQFLRGTIPGEVDRIESAKWHDYSVRDGWRHFPRRRGEPLQEFLGRDKTYTYVAAYAAEQLSASLYGLPPVRSYHGGASWMGVADAAAHVNEVMLQAHWAALIGGVAVVHVEPTGPRSYKLHLYRRHEFTMWPSQDPCKPLAVATHGFTDEGRRITRVWDERTVATYLSDGDFVVDYQHDVYVMPTMRFHSREPHGYNQIPFFLVHAKFPVSTTWTNGIGRALSNLNRIMDVMATDTDQAHAECAIPIAVATNISPDQEFSRTPGAINRFTRDAIMSLNELQNPAIEYFSPSIAMTELESFATQKCNRILSEIGVDPAIVTHVNAYTSGAAVVARLAAQSQYRRMTTGLANFWEQLRFKLVSELVTNVTPDPLHMQVIWEELRPAAWVPELQVVDSNDVALGVMSVPDVIQRRTGMSRTSAIERAQQIAKDNEQFRRTAEPTNVNPSGQLPLPPDSGK